MRTLARLAVLATLAAALPGAWGQQMQVKIERRGDAVVVDVEVQVPAPVPDTWAVLTDYEHMTAFMSNLKASTVLSRQGNSLELAQTGEARFAFMSFTFSSVRAVDLVPMREIRTRLISGDFKSFDTVTKLVDQGAGTLLVHHGEYVTKTWVPPIVSTSSMEDETRKQYVQLVAEIVRRHTAGNAVQPTAAAAAPAAASSAR